MSTVSESLSELEVLVVDCQATAAAPHGHLLEIGWARAGPTTARADARLIALPDGEQIPAAVVRLTGISERMSQDGVDARVAWREVSNEAATLARQPAPTVIHFARFEEPFLRALAGGALPLDILCTHDIARRLLPDLPRCGVRALSGYFGRGVGALRRSADHVAATAFVWRELVRLLRNEGISTWSVLQEWLADNRATRQRRRRVWPMPRNVRLSLPDAPGVYRMLRTSGDVLYVGKAASLRHRVNSYFRKQTGVPERTLEMLSQARGISFDVAPSALEAALIEPDEIKQHRPPYNVALTIENRALWFAAPNLTARSVHPSSQCPLGPFPSAGMLDQFGALATAESRALGSSRWRPEELLAVEPGVRRVRSAGPHPPTFRTDVILAQVKTRRRTIGKSDVRDVRDTIERHAAAGFLLIGYPQFSGDLINYLETLRHRGESIEWWSRKQLEERLRKNLNIAARYSDVVRYQPPGRQPADVHH
jgi:DNA polymerase III epsilon subunit-like protein